MRAPTDRAWAIFFCRAILGLIFFMAGVYKCFVMTPFGHARRYFVGPYADTFLPTWSLWATGTLVPVVELIAGALVLVGFKTRSAPRSPSARPRPPPGRRRSRRRPRAGAAA